MQRRERRMLERTRVEGSIEWGIDAACFSQVSTTKHHTASEDLDQGDK